MQVVCVAGTGDATGDEEAFPNPYKGVVLVAKTLTGETVEINIDDNRPTIFKVIIFFNKAYMPLVNIKKIMER